MRFSIRDVLWLTVVVGLAVGWWADHSMLRTVIRVLGNKWHEHLRREHPGDEERLMSEWIVVKAEHL